MSDASAVARDQLRSFIERIERLEEEKKSIADDIKDVKAEAKGCGFDVGIINAIIKLRKVDANERAERDALLDTYMIALGMLPEPPDDDFDQETGEVFDDRRSDLGLNIQTKHTDIRSGGLSPAPAGLTTRPAEESVVPHSDQPLVGGDHEVASSAERERETVTSNTGEGAANTALPAKPKFVLRPYCRNPGETCGGSGTTHCHSCLKAREEVAA